MRLCISNRAIHLSICIYLCIYRYIGLFIYKYIYCVYICVYIHPSIHQPINLSIYLLIHPSTYYSIHLPINTFVNISTNIYQCIRPYLHHVQCLMPPDISLLLSIGVVYIKKTAMIQKMLSCIVTPFSYLLHTSKCGGVGGHLWKTTDSDAACEMDERWKKPTLVCHVFDIPWGSFTLQGPHNVSWGIVIVV